MRHIRISCALCVLLLSVAPLAAAEESNSDSCYRPSPRPAWELTDWWITETHVLINISQLDGGPNQLADILFYHKWSVAGKERVGKVECWVVEIRAHNLPKDVVNDHKGDYLIRLYLNKDDYSLVKLERNHREGTYHVTGARVNKNSQSFEKGESAIITSWPIMCPLDIPKLPDSWHESGLMEKEKEIKYVDEWSSENAIQRVQPFSTDPEGKSPAMLITLIRKEWPIRTMMWLPDRPWWSEWRCQTADGKIENVWYSKMIDWKGKAEEANRPPDGNANPTAPDETPLVGDGSTPSSPASVSSSPTGASSVVPTATDTAQPSATSTGGPYGPAERREGAVAEATPFPWVIVIVAAAAALALGAITTLLLTRAKKA